MKELEPKGRLLDSWIESFIEWTNSHPTVYPYQMWSGLSAIGAAMNRKCWVVSARRKVYPNLFVANVGEPGKGKDIAIEAAEYLLRVTKTCPIAPASMSAKGLVDALAAPESKVTFMMKDRKSGRIHTTNSQSLIACIPELGTALPEYSASFLSIANELYGCKPKFEDKIRGRVETTVIDNPCLNLLIGTQPDYLGTTFRDEAFGMGFFSRIILIYATEWPEVDLWGEAYEDDADAYEDNTRKESLGYKLIHDLKRIGQLSGRFAIPKTTRDIIDDWKNETQKTDKLTHSKLLHYNSRRILHLLKTCQIFSASRTDAMIVLPEDFENAYKTLKEAEVIMPLIFSAMTSSRGDKSHMEEAQQQVAKFVNAKKRHMPEHLLIQFLSGRVPTYQIGSLIDSMVAAKLIKATDTGRGERVLTTNKPKDKNK